MSNKTAPKWQPTKDMWNVLKAWCDMETKPTVKDRMERAGVRRENWWEWIRKPEFVRWWNKQTEDFMKTTISDLNRISYLKASSDFRYMELLQMKYGGFKRSESRDVTSKGDKLDAGIFIVPPKDEGV